MSQAKTIASQLPHITRYLLILGVITFISLLFPNSLQFHFQFERGQSWRYDDLLAPFDFAVKKTDEEMQAALAQLQSEFPPYYEMNLDIVKAQQKSFAEAFRQQLLLVKGDSQFREVNAAPDRYLNYGLQFLERLYEQGIIELNAAHKNQGKDFVINCLRGNVAQEQTLEYFLTTDKAKARISDSLPYSRLQEPEFLFSLLENTITPNVRYNAELTARFLDDALSKIPDTRGMVRKGDTLVMRGNIITDETYQKLISLKEQYEQRITGGASGRLVFVGYLLLTLLIVGIFAIYLWMFAPAIFRKHKELIFILIWPTLYSYLVYVVENADSLSAYMIPFCIAPIIIKTFYNNQLAFFTHVTVILLASFLSSLGYEFTVLQLLAGIVVVLSNIDTRNWSRFFLSLIYLFMTLAVAFLGLSLIQEGSFSQITWSVYVWIFINVFLTMLAYPLIPLLERLFGYISPITLMELSDMNRPLLRELAIKAPGTLQHSLQVGNLAEAAARRVGADTLLVKTAALYHDIGKTIHPEYFIENQSGSNPHNNIPLLDSAQRIIEHVTEGVQIAKKHRLPNILIDFIRTHHGTTRVEYFYRKYLEINPEQPIDESLFRYPGPKPRSKEEAIVMLADSIEAACKSLKNPTETQINDMIDKIISGKIANGQLEDSRLTFRELEICKKEFKKLMKSVHHARIEYPEERKV